MSAWIETLLAGLKEISKDEVTALPYVLVSALAIKQSYIYRQLRRLLLPAGVAALVFRTYKGLDQSLLSSIQKWIASSHSGQVRQIAGDVCGLMVVAGLLRASADLLSLRDVNVRKKLLDEVFNLLRVLPPVQQKLEAEKSKARADFERDLKSHSRSIGTALVSLPKQGASHESILALMRDATSKEDLKWKDRKVTGAVYSGDATHQKFLNEAFGMYSLSNPLHPEIWPSAMKFESEIISMTASLMNGNGLVEVCGSTTSGGTESIIIAIKAHRDYYRNVYGITEPELVACISAHAAVNKACDMLGIRLVHVPMTDKFQVDLRALESAIGPNTIMMYGSAPNYAQGTIDPIRQMGELAVKYDIGLHVDCCLGGFVLPFARKLGYDVPDFDFTVPGVSSMSVDTHKYGYALKGASVVLYRTEALRRAQYFCYADWAGGMYTTPTVAGSRSGGMLAQCWASLVALGEEGYKKNVAGIMSTTRALADGIRGITDLQLLGDAPAMIVCFAGQNGVNVYAVVDEMSKRGWALGSHQSPPCAHLCITMPHVGCEDKFLVDLREAVQAVKSNPDASKHGSAAIYGLTSSLPNGPVNDMLMLYNDVVLRS